MKNYDVIVIGSGCGMGIVERAVSNKLKVALVDKGPVGGTCANTGCIPSKMLIHPADRIMEIREAARLGINVNIEKVDFPFIMERMRKTIREAREEQREAIIASQDFDFYESEGRFVADYTIEVNGQQIKGEKIFIAAGARPMVPPIKGLDSVDYLTNESVLELEELPSSLIIIGGGYIAVEYGHFFEAMGTQVTMIEMTDRLVAAEEAEISDVLLTELTKRMGVYLNTTAQEVGKGGEGIRVWVKDNEAERRSEYSAEKLLVAVGRRSNADLLDLDKTGVKVNQRGFIEVDEYLQTSRKNIYAIGDINGQMMFTHMGNAEANLAAGNGLDGRKTKVDYRAAPHAVYSYPQIASVGLTQKQAQAKHKIIVGQAMYSSTAKGEAMMEEVGFAKAIADENSLEILGFHIVGPHAPILIQEAINAMSSGGHLNELIDGIHIHPALSELIQMTIGYLEEPLEGHQHVHTAEEG